MSEQGVIWGVKPVFNDFVDLEVTDPITKALMLTYLKCPGELDLNRTYPLNIDFSDARIGLVSEVGYEVIIPFLSRTFFDHWTENRIALTERMFVKFIPLTYQSAKNQLYKARKDVEGQGYDQTSVFFAPLFGKVEEYIGEYISLLYFRSLGYSTTNFVPLTGVRVPDITCWKTPLLRKLKEFNLVENGTTLYELSMLRVFGKIKSNGRGASDTSDESLVVEVESDSPYSGIVQLLGPLLAEGNYSNAKPGYVQGGNYDKAFIVAPFYKNENEDRVGVLSFDERGLYFKDCPKNFSVEQSKQRSIREMDDLIRMVLLTNFTIEEMQELVPRGSHSFFKLLSELYGLKEDKILQKLSQIVPT